MPMMVLVLPVPVTPGWPLDECDAAGAQRHFDGAKLPAVVPKLHLIR